jgi:protein NrfC
VKIDPKRCMGCNYCITACPYDARWSNPLTGLPEKCMGEGCQKLVAEGKDPACVAACPTNARVFGDILDPKSAISREIASSRTVKLLEEKGTLPNFFVEVAK